MLVDKINSVYWGSNNILNNSKDELEKKDLEEKYIFIDTKIVKNRVTIFIKDNAGGISDKIIDKIFDLYFTTKGKVKGTGIGLYMSKEIIEKHMKGTIGAKNESYTYNEKSHKGANFFITFSLKKEKESKEKESI